VERVAILDPSDPGLYRNQRGYAGASPIMSPDVGTGGRYMITTGEAHAVNGGTSALPSNWRRVLDPHSPSFAVLILGTVLILIHASAGAHLSGGVSAGVRK
jgi:hypothetical protein